MNNNVSLPWHQAVKNNKLLAIIAVSEAVCIVILALAIAVMLPLKEKDPVYVEFSSGGNNFVRITKAGENISSNALLVTYFLRKYVIDRETVDKTTEQVRYARIAASSAPELYKRFQSVYGDEKKGLYYKEGFKRAVTIVRDDALGVGIHQIEIKTADTDGDNRENIKRGEWVITMRYSFAEQKIGFDERLNNPIGLLVTEYTITARKKS